MAAERITIRGIIRGRTVLLEKEVSLPEGTQVEVTLWAPPSSKEAAIERVLKHGLQNAVYKVGIDELIEEDRAEREEGIAEWL